jgi:hypothetical protein
MAMMNSGGTTKHYLGRSHSAYDSFELVEVLGPPMLPPHMSCSETNLYRTRPP